MDEKLQLLYNSLSANPNVMGLPKDYNSFATALQDPGKSQVFYNSLKANPNIKGLPDTYDDFVSGLITDMGGVEAPKKAAGDIATLKNTAKFTRESLTTARQKLEEDYTRQFRYPTTSTMQPGGQGTYNWESPEQADAFYSLEDKKKKLDLAIDYLDRAINVPEEKKGAGKAAFQNELHNIISAGVVGMLDDILTARTAKQLAKGEKDDVGEALIDAYGKLQQLSSLAGQEVPRYRRASSIAGSIPYMEQFLLTGGVGTGAAGVAGKATQAITKGVTSKIIQGAAKRVAQPIIEGAVSMIGRVPLSPATYGNIAQEAIGNLKQVNGQYFVDPGAMPSIAQSIAKGTYGSAKEIFTESLGGMVALPTSLFPKALNAAITPNIRKLFKQVGMNNPAGEYFEEVAAALLGGEKVDPQFLKDLILTIPVITGGFSALSIPAVAKNLKIVYNDKKVAEKFGSENINRIRELVEANDEDGLTTFLYNLRVDDATAKDYSNLWRFAGSMVQEKTINDLESTQEVTPATPLTPQNLEVEDIINIYGQQLKFGRTPIAEDPNPMIVLATHKLDGRKFFLTNATVEGNAKIFTAYDVDALKEVGFDFTKVKPEMIKSTDIDDRMNIPYAEWFGNEVELYKQTQQESEKIITQSEAPVQEGQEIVLQDKVFNVTAVDQGGITLNEIDKDGNLTGGELMIPPEDYEKVFGVPAQDQGIQPTEPNVKTVKLGKTNISYQEQPDGSFFIPANATDDIEKIAKQVRQEVDTENFDVIPLTEEIPIENVAPFAKIKTQKVATGIRIIPKVKPKIKEETKNAETIRTGHQQVAPQGAPTLEPGEGGGRNLRYNEQAGVAGQQEQKVPPEEEVTEIPPVPAETAPVVAEKQKAGEVEEEQKPTIDLTKANAEVDIHPSEAEIKAGNYKHGHLSVQGMEISIENPAGSIRKGTDKTGKEWSVMLNNSYGYFRRTKGKDGDQIDVFLGENLNPEKVYVIDQVDPETKIFDEHKVMLGFNSAEDARENYLANYEPLWKGLGAISKMPVNEFKKWLGNGTRTRKPASAEIQVKQTKEEPAVRALKEFRKGDLVKNNFTGNIFEVVEILKGKNIIPDASIKNIETGEIKLTNINRVQWLPAQKEVTLKQRKKPGKPSPESKTGRALSKSPENFEEAVLHFFVGGGKIWTQDIISHVVKKENKKELNKYFGLYANDGIHMDVLHDNLPNSFGIEDNKDPMAEIDTIVEVLRRYNSSGKMIDELLRRQEEPVDADYSDEEIHDEIDNLQPEVIEVNDDIMEDPEVKDLMQRFTDENGLNVDKLLEEIDFNPGLFRNFGIPLREEDIYNLKSRLQDEQRRRKEAVQEVTGRTGGTNIEGPEQDTYGGDKGNEAGPRTEEVKPPAEPSGEQPAITPEEQEPAPAPEIKQIPEASNVKFFPNSALKGKKVTIKATNAETGEVETVTANAFVLQKQLRKRSALLKKLQDCVG